MFSLLSGVHVQLHVEHGRAAWRVLGSPGGKHGKPCSQTARVCVSSRLWYFFLIFTSLSLFFSCNCARFVSVSLSHPFLHIIFSFYCGFIPFFFKCYFSVILFLFPHTFGKNPLHVSLFSLFSLFPFHSPFPFSQPSSFSQHWNSGGSHAEELERPGARPRLKTRPQPPLFHPFTCSEPQFTDCVALSEHSIPGGQIALQMSVLMKN